jgi:hypothetical protein
MTIRHVLHATRGQRRDLAIEQALFDAREADDGISSAHQDGCEPGMGLAHWISDGLMTFFSLLIGLEVRGKVDMGEFHERLRVAAPVIATPGGMLSPVAIFMALNAGSE